MLSQFRASVGQRRSFSARHEDHRGDDERLVAGLLVGGDAVFLEHARRHLALRATDAGNVRRQAMHVERLAAVGQLHLLLVALPVLVACALLARHSFSSCLEPVLVALAAATACAAASRGTAPTISDRRRPRLERLFHARAPPRTCRRSSRLFCLRRLQPPRESARSPPGCASDTFMPKRVIRPMMPCGTDSGLP